MARFDRDSARRLAEAARFVERRPRNGVDRAAGAREHAYNKIGKLTTALTARSGSTPGTGTVQPYLLTATSLVSKGSPVPMVNWTGSAVASGLPVKYTVVDGVLTFDGQDCSGVALP